MSKKKTIPKKRDVKEIRTIELILATLLALVITSSIVSVFLFCHINTVPKKEVTSNITGPISTDIFGINTSISSQENVGVPVRIMIPSIGINAPIERVGLKPDGSMDVPKDPMNTGWYELGPRPGEIGSSVIDGHVDWWYGAPAVFPNLRNLKAGDSITIQDEFGTTFSFVVRETRTYNATANASDVFASYDGRSHLNLITCAGVWDYNSSQYSNRLVVFADRR